MKFDLHYRARRRESSENVSAVSSGEHFCHSLYRNTPIIYCSSTADHKGEGTSIYRHVILFLIQNFASLGFAEHQEVAQSNQGVACIQKRECAACNQGVQDVNRTLTRKSFKYRPIPKKIELALKERKHVLAMEAFQNSLIVRLLQDGQDRPAL